MAKLQIGDIIKSVKTGHKYIIEDIIDYGIEKIYWCIRPKFERGRDTGDFIGKIFRRKQIFRYNHHIFETETLENSFVRDILRHHA